MCNIDSYEPIYYDGEVLINKDGRLIRIIEVINDRYVYEDLKDNITKEDFCKEIDYWYSIDLSEAIHKEIKRLSPKIGDARKKHWNFQLQREQSLLLAKKYNAPRELTLQEAKEINPRYNEKLGKIYMNTYGEIMVENPYPNHKVISYGTLNSHYLEIDGRKIQNDEDISAYWFGEK